MPLCTFGDSNQPNRRKSDREYELSNSGVPVKDHLLLRTFQERVFRFS